jgi:pyrimidine deaminase RibD-like protein
MSKLDNNEVYKELFNAKKNIYNDTHNILIHGVPVELYVQDAREPVVSLGEYSIKDNKWLRLPTKRRANFDQNATKAKYEKLQDLIEFALRTRRLGKVEKTIKKIKQYRQAGLDKGGEFGPENLAYKMLRNQGYITKLYDLRDKLHSEVLTIETMYQDPAKIQEENLATLFRNEFANQFLGMSMQEAKQNGYNEAVKKASIKVEELLKGELASSTINESQEEEIHNYPKLDHTLAKLCKLVIEGQKSDKDYGMVAACVIDPDNNFVIGLNAPGVDGKRIHAERVAIEKYENEYGPVPEGSIVVTTLSPCNEQHDETAAEREGESCTDYLNSKGIEKVYCGYNDPTQDNNNREFNIMETSNKELRAICKKFADTFLSEDDTMQFAAEKTAAVSPYSGLKDVQFRGSVSEASGYIPSEKEKNDPRFKTALTVDVHPDSIKKNAKAFYWKTNRAGIPPTAKASGKI